MKKLLLSSALLGALAFPALAQDQSIFREAPDDLEIRASQFMGMRLYSTEAELGANEAQGVQQGWDDIGEVNDIIFDRDGQVQAVLVDIGGFLGIGERTVAVSMDALHFVSDSATADNANDYFLVINSTRDALENAPQYGNLQGDMTAEQAAQETEQAIDQTTATAAATGAAAGAAVGAAVEGTENAVEETGEEVAQAGQEVADETADAGEEVAEEANQVGMTDVQEDQAEMADTAQDNAEEAAEETSQANAEAADEQADQAEAVAEGNATETEMETDQTVAAATDQASTDQTAATDEAATTMTDQEMATAEQTSAETTRTPITREGYVAAGAEDFTAERLQGTAVYGANDERVGEVGEIVLNDSGQVQELVIDVGGFLGIGEKPVALPMDSVDILKQEGGEELRVYVSQTKDELEQMPRYEGQQ